MLSSNHQLPLKERLERALERILRGEKDLVAELRELDGFLSHVISSNESLKDVGTQDLKFLLVPAYLAELMSNQPFGSLPERVEVVSSAKTKLLEFFGYLSQLELLREAEQKHLERLMAGKFSYQGDPAKTREEKIARFKAEKETSLMLQTLRLRQENNEDVERQLVLVWIESLVQKSMDLWQVLWQEEEMLTQQLANPVTESARIETLQLDPNTPLLSDTGKPMRPFVIMSREAQKKQVFRPGHRLPTLSIDEYLDREMERGNFISSKDTPPVVELDTDRYDVADAELMKQRQKDEFRDDNPKGWGNTKGNRG